MSFSFSSRNASVKTLLFQRKPLVVFRSVYPKYPLYDAAIDLQHLSRKAYNIRCKVKDEAKDYTFVVVDMLINYTWFCHVNEGNTHGTKLALEKLHDYNQQWRSPNDIDKMLETSREDEL